MAVKASANITLTSVVDIQATYRYYLLQSSTLSKPSKPTTNPPSSSWDDTEPTYTSGSTNSLYYVDLTVFSNGTFSYSEVSLSTAYEAAKEAYNKAQNAQNSADQAQSDIDNLEIGGRNYMLNSAEKSIIGVSSNTSIDYTFSDAFLPDVKGKDVTISAYFEATELVEGTSSHYGIDFCIKFSDGTNIWSNATRNNIVNADTNGNIAGKRYVRTITILDKEITEISSCTVFIRGYDSIGSFTIKDIKIEIGNRATDWTPAPEDLVTNNELTTNYYTKVDTDAKFELTEESITSTVSATYATKSALTTVDAKIDNLEIGGRNLLTGTQNDEWQEIPADGTAVLYYVRPYTELAALGVTAGDMLCYSVGLKTDVAMKLRMILTSDISDHRVVDVKGEYFSGEGRALVSAEVPATAQYVRMYISSEGTGVADAFWKGEKLEKGNKPTDWTPAPEDLEEATATAQDTAETAQQSADSVGEKVFTVESVVTQLAESISSLVRGQNGESLMTQTDDGWMFSITSIQNELSSAITSIGELNSDMSDTNTLVNSLNQTVADLGVYTDYIEFGVENDQPCIILGETDSPFKVVITNTDIRFMEGSAIPAYINNQSLYVEKAVISDELKQGGFVWMARENGNYGLLWRGE